MSRFPRVRSIGRVPESPSALVLVLHGGRSRSHARTNRFQLAYLRMLPFARSLARAGGRRGLAVWMVRYRYRGWNGPAMDAKQDAMWALDEAQRRNPGVPVVMVGHSMGGRAALHAAGHPMVRAVCALAPWLDGTDPVEQLAGRTVLIAHGDQERMTDPAQSYAFAVRAKLVTAQVCRFDVQGDGHAMLRRARDWSSLVRRFVLGELGIEPPDPEITNALCQPAPAGLRAELSGAPR
ncbi:MAG: alpha/beta hydrolase [Pseudonocardia sp.]